MIPKFDFRNNRTRTELDDFMKKINEPGPSIGCIRFYLLLLMNKHLSTTLLNDGEGYRKENRVFIVEKLVTTKIFFFCRRIIII